MPPKRKSDVSNPEVDAAKEPLSRDNLKAACWCTVAMIAKEEESQGLSIAVSEAFVATLGELVFQQALSLGKDLEAFAAHANRSTIEVDDVRLAVRRNEPLYSALTSSAQRNGIALSTSTKLGGALTKKSAKPVTAPRAQPRVSKAAQAATAAKRALAEEGQQTAAGASTKSKGKAKAIDSDDVQSGSGSDSDVGVGKKKTASNNKGKGKVGPSDKAKGKKKASADDGDDARTKAKSKAKDKALVKNTTGKGKAKAVVSSSDEDEGEGLGSGFDSDDSDDLPLIPVKKKQKT